VPVPIGVASEQVDAVIRYLDYLDACLDTSGRSPAITLIVRALTFEKAMHYGVERVLASIDALRR
jgi:hypothetical protein